MNIDTAEIDKFSKLQQEWWNPQGECQPLHAINPLRLMFMQQFVNFADKQVVDIGCGGGILAEGMAKLGARVIGIDLAEGAIAAAQEHLSLSKLTIDYQLITAEAFAQQQTEKFDIVTCMEMLEHVPDPMSIIQSCATLVKPGGKIFLSTLNRNVKSYASAIIGAEWILKLLPKGTHDYAKFIRPSELAAWAREAGLSVKTLQGLTYSPFTKKYQLTSDVSVNYLMACEKI